MSKIIHSLFFVISVMLVIFGTAAFINSKTNNTSISKVIHKQDVNKRVAVLNASILLEKKGDFSNALDTLKSIYDTYKDDYLINLRIGWLYYSLKNYDESVVYYEKAISISKGKSVESILGSTYPLSGLNNWESVMQKYRSVLKLDPGNYTANLRLGQIYLNSGDYKQAKQHLDKILQFYPSDYEVNLSSAWNSYYLGDQKKARDLFNEVLAVNPNDSSAFQGMDLLK